MDAVSKRVTAGIYTRISLDAGGEALGVERQAKLCRELAKKKGWQVVETYQDNDQSASTDKARPEYSRMLADIAAGRINGVVVYAIDRLTRRPIELEHFIELVEKHGVQLANIAGDIQLDTPMGQAQARMMGLVARLEAQNIGRRVRDQKEQRAFKGIPHKGRHRLFGYDENWTPVEPEAAFIKEAFKRRARGESSTSIANDFTVRGIKTVGGRDWTSGTLTKTLTRHVYAGKVTFKGEVVADSIYPALVDIETFNAAQANLANDSGGTNTRRYLLSGILVCGHCTTAMKGNPSNQMYRCSTTYGGCGKLSVRIALADKWVTWAAMQRANMTPKKAEPVRDFAAEIAAAEAERAKLQADYRAGVYELPEVRPLIEAQRQLLREATTAQARAVPRLNYATQKYMDYGRMNLSQKRAFITAHVTNVVVGPAVSRGHQPFDPSRFECLYPDGTTETIEHPGEEPQFED